MSTLDSPPGPGSLPITPLRPRTPFMNRFPNSSTEIVPPKAEAVDRAIRNGRADMRSLEYSFANVRLREIDCLCGGVMHQHRAQHFVSGGSGDESMADTPQTECRWMTA